MQTLNVMDNFTNLLARVTPPTGDETTLLPFIIIAVIAFILILALIIIKSKKK